MTKGIPLEALAYNYFHDKVTELSAVFEQCNLNSSVLYTMGKRVDENCIASPNDGKSHDWFAALEYFRDARIRFLFPWKGRNGLIKPISVSADQPVIETKIAFLCYELIRQMKPYELHGGAQR